MENTKLSPKADEPELGNVEFEKNKAIQLIGDLDNRLINLPEGEPDPKSPDVEDMYAKKEESILKLEKHLNVLFDCQRIANECVKENNQKLQILNKDKDKLNSTKAKRKYLFAEFIQKNKCKKAEYYKNDLNRVIDCAQKAISLANTKKFPGGNPQKKSPFPPLIPRTQSQSDPMPPPVLPQIHGKNFPLPPITPPIPAIPTNPNPIANQVNSLIPLGPIGK